MSEFGAAALYGSHEPSNCKWTEEYQAAVLDESLRNWSPAQVDSFLAVVPPGRRAFSSRTAWRSA